MAKLNQKLNHFSAISPLDGRYWERAKELSSLVSLGPLINTRLKLETLYLLKLSEEGIIRNLNDRERKFLLRLSNGQNTSRIRKIEELEKITRHDVKAVEQALRLFLSGTSMEDLTPMIHFGLTSEDINNLAYRIILQGALEKVCIPNLNQVIDNLIKKAIQYRLTPMLARTHGQPAVPTTLGKEFTNYAVRLNKQVIKLTVYKMTGKLNGAVGNYNAFHAVRPDVDWIKFSRDFIEDLGFKPNLYTTQINPNEDLIEVFQILQRINGILVDLDQDMWRYISDGWFTQAVKPGEIGSSTMPQKVNPIDFENSEGNLQFANGIWETMCRKFSVSRLQRDLSDSTVMRNFGVGLAHGLLAHKSTLTGLERITPNTELISSVLNENWTILAEGAQTILRLEGVKDPYSLLEKFVKGSKVTEEDWRAWVSALEVDRAVKEKLLGLTPETYLGLAVVLTDMAIDSIKSSRKHK